MSKTIATANELLSGATVYLTASGAWVDDFNAVRVFDESEATELAELMDKAKKTGRLLSLETEEVDVDAGRVVPRRLRERIRAEGPTAPRHPIQSLQEGDHVSI